MCALGIPAFLLHRILVLISDAQRSPNCLPETLDLQTGDAEITSSGVFISLAALCVS